MTLIEDSSPIGEVLVDEFNEYFVIILNSFRVKNVFESLEKLGCNGLPLFSFDSKLNDGTTGMKWFEDCLLYTSDAADE